MWQSSVPASNLRTPMDFGAVGDGLSDDTDALQRAIDATQNGGSLYFPGGHKYLVRSLHATGEVHWLGPGGSWLNDRAADGAVIVQGNNASQDLLTLTNAAYSNVSGVAFDGNKLNQTKPLNGIRLVNCEFTRFDNIYVTSCSGNGILLENVNTLQTSDTILRAQVAYLPRGIAKLSEGITTSIRGMALVCESRLTRRLRELTFSQTEALESAPRTARGSTFPAI